MCTLSHFIGRQAVKQFYIQNSQSEAKAFITNIEGWRLSSLTVILPMDDSSMTATHRYYTSAVLPQFIIAAAII